MGTTDKMMHPRLWARNSRLLGTSARQRVAIVTGGAQGLGAAISSALANKAGDKVIVADLHSQGDKGEQLAESLNGHFVECDVTNSQSVQAMYTAVAAKHGSVDVVVANAGVVCPQQPTHTLPDEQWERVSTVNGFGFFLTIKYALQQMLKQETGGVLLGMSSVAGLGGHNGLAPYVFTKHGVVGVTKSVAAEYATHNIRMNCINPGGCDTEMLRDFIKTSPDPVAMQAALYSSNPVPGVIHPDAVGDAAVYLCSSTNCWVTGVALPVDGGYLAGHAPFTSLF